MAATTKRKKKYVPIVRYDRNVVGKVVRKLREAQGLSRDELVARAQLSGWSISFKVLKRIESGEREVTDIELRKLARILRVPVAHLLK